MKVVRAYLYKSRVYLHASSKTEMGFWIATPPFISTDEKDVPELAINIERCLQVSSENIANPEEWKGLLQPLLKLANAASLSKFHLHAKCVSIEYDEAGYSITPYENYGAREGFKPIVNNRRLLSEKTSYLDVGRTVIIAFTDCT